MYKELLEDAIMMVRMSAFSTMYAVLFLIINEKVKIPIRGRIYAMIVALKNLLQSLLPLAIIKFFKFISL